MLQPYLPQLDSMSRAGSSPYSEGGALYTLGLIHPARGKDVLSMLWTTLCDVSGKVVQCKVAALGVGVASMSSQDQGETFYYTLARFGTEIPYQMHMMTSSKHCSLTVPLPVKPQDLPWD
jgi:hypothetical protein